MSQIVVTCRKLSWRLSQIVVTFFSRPLPAVPFWISPIQERMRIRPLLVGEMSRSGSRLKWSRLENSSCVWIVTLRPLQKNVVNIFYVFAWEFCIEKWRGFLVNFFWSPFPSTQSTKTPRKIRGKFGEKFGAKSGTQIRKIRGTLVLRLFRPYGLSISRGQSGLIFSIAGPSGLAKRRPFLSQRPCPNCNEADLVVLLLYQASRWINISNTSNTPEEALQEELVTQP